MKKTIKLLPVFLLGLVSSHSTATTFNWNGGDGNWSDTTQWDVVAIPDTSSGDEVFISSGQVAVPASGITLNNNGSLSLTGNTTRVSSSSGGLDVKPTGTVNISGGATAEFRGRMAIQGTVNLEGTGSSLTTLNITEFNSDSSINISNGATFRSQGRIRNKLGSLITINNGNLLTSQFITNRGTIVGSGNIEAAGVIGNQGIIRGDGDGFELANVSVFGSTVELQGNIKITDAFRVSQGYDIYKVENLEMLATSELSLLIAPENDDSSQLDISGLLQLNDNVLKMSNFKSLSEFSLDQEYQLFNFVPQSIGDSLSNHIAGRFSDIMFCSSGAGGSCSSLDSQWNTDLLYTDGIISYTAPEVAAVPIPAALPLLGSSLLILMGSIRRRSKA